MATDSLPRLRLVLCSVGVVFAGVARAANFVSEAPFDDNWEFSHDRSSWTPVTLPHDWAIAGPFSADAPTQGAGAFLPAGVGYYQKHFQLSARDLQGHVAIEFDGVMAHSDVSLNGRLLGHRPYGYVSFSYDLTPSAHAGDNLLEVKADNSQEPASRWYPGAGIYRHVRLVRTGQVHFQYQSIFVTTPAATSDQASIHLTGTIENDSDHPVSPTVTISLPHVGSKRASSSEIAPHSHGDFSVEFTLTHPELWSPDHPSLYSAACSLPGDRRTVSFGIRESHFDAATGYWINGRNVKLKGVCLHDDVSALGAAAPLSAWERRLVALRALGVNAIRTAHNPPDPGFLDLCDRLGFLVMDEFFDCWTVGKNLYDYHLDFNAWSERDETDSIRRDRNHPSVILWSVGNEIHDTPHQELAKTILTRLVRTAHANDPTRPVTQALFRPNVSHDYDDGLADLLDVVGTNYRYKELLAAHDAKPARKIIGTENHREREEWLAVRDNADYAGEFLWTGVDYLGESRSWPTVAAGSGLIDRTAVPRAIGYEFQSWWSDRPMVKAFRRLGANARVQADPGYAAGVDTGLRYRQVLFGDWTPADAGAHPETVEVYSNCDEVELLLNGKSLGRLGRNPDLAPRRWQVTYAPGTLEAVGYHHGREAARDRLRTAGAPARIVLAAETTQLPTGWEHVGYLSATVVDAKGIPVPGADAEIAFAVTGPGRLVAVDSADNRSHEPFQSDRRHAYQGQCWALIRAEGAGKITVHATAEGLAAGQATLAGTAGVAARAASR